MFYVCDILTLRFSSETFFNEFLIVLGKLSVGCQARTNETIKNNFNFCILNESHRVDCTKYLNKDDIVSFRF